MPSIPIPRRGLRSLALILALILGPYIVVRHITTIDNPTGPGASWLQRQSSGRGGAVVRDAVRGAGWLGSWKSDKRRTDSGQSSTSGKGKGRVLGDRIAADEGGIEHEAAYRQADEEDESDSTEGRRVSVRAKKGKAVDEDSRSSEDSGDSEDTGGSGKRSAKGVGGRGKLPAHTYLDNGLVKVNPDGRHPIFDLMEKAQEKWDDKLARSSQTLGQAVNEYRRRYSRAPPRGFERWWDYAQRNNVQLPDEYDQIHSDLEPFWALTPKQVQNQINRAAGKSGMYTIFCPGNSAVDPACTFKLVEQGLNSEGLLVAKQRVEKQLELLEDIQDDLEEVKAVFYSHDVPWQFVGHEYKSALEDSASVGEIYDVAAHELDWAHLGWASACAPHKPLRKSYDTDVYPDLEDLWSARSKTFIWDHKASMDPCMHPAITHLAGFLSGHGKGPGPSKELYPVMAMCKTTLHSDVLAVSMEAWQEDVEDDPPWDDKTSDKMIWRGKNTGIYFKEGVPWNISQRINLVERTAMTDGVIPVLPVKPDYKAVGNAKLIPLMDLNDDLVDVGFVDDPIQCDPEVCDELLDKYKFAERKTWAESNEYKYVLDIDGNGWSARFKRLMTSNSLVLKSTIFPEWYTDRVQPWVHYVPIKPDLTDLYDTLSFFRLKHDGRAKKIAMEGKKWSQTFWRREDMVSYQFRLFLEYSRLMAPDRDKASFHARGNELDMQ